MGKVLKFQGVPVSIAITALAAMDGLAEKGVSTIDSARVYLYLASYGPCSLTKIVDALKIPFSSVSRIGWQLQEAGLVTYQDHPTDRRQKILTAVTAKSMPLSDTLVEEGLPAFLRRQAT